MEGGVGEVPVNSLHPIFVLRLTYQCETSCSMFMESSIFMQVQLLIQRLLASECNE